MNKTQKFLKFINSAAGFSIILLVFIIVLFTILSPKVSSLLFPFKRQAVLNEFINKTKTAGTVNGQEYWQFREFYSPGYFTFSRTGITESLINNAVTKIGIKYSQNEVDWTGLFFSSQRLNSLDMLTKQSSLNKLIDQKQFQKGKVIFMSSNSLIYQEDPKTVKIIFLLSNSEMQKANGFFAYQDKDKQLTTGENWFNITSLKED
jgi:hypothetical protein